jgi:enediyne biosynthesis protein E4
VNTTRLVRAAALPMALTITASALALSAAPPQQPSAAPAAVRYVPDDLQESTVWLQKRREAQAKAIAGVQAFHDFQFVDRVADSGITFRHRIVEDAGKTYKAAHYDHGNGLAVADVDGDGLVDVYFVNQVGGNQLWRNTGGGKFENITSAAGLAVPGRVSVSASFGDIDNDGDADLFVTTVRAGNLLFENDGRGRFSDITAAAGLGYSGHSSSGVFFDYDRDGRLDLLLVNVGRYTTNTVAGGSDKFYVAFADAFAGHLKPERAERSILYRNASGNRFADVSKATGLVDLSWTGDATVLDGNDDGWPDLYLTNMQGDDQYYENAAATARPSGPAAPRTSGPADPRTSERRFLKKSRVLFPRTSWGSMGVKVFDFNNDGRLDLFVTDMHSDMSHPASPDRDFFKSEMKWPVSFRGTGKTSIWGNSFFLNDAPGRYREVSDAIGAESYCPWGPSVGDLNADGYDDVFIAAGMNYPERYMVNSVKLNDRGRRFADAEFVLGVEPRSGGLATPFFELDASGADKGHKDAVGETGRIAIWGARGTRSSAILDLDGDGDLDIVTNEFNAAPMVLVSNLSEKTRVRYVAVRLAGTISNRSGLGAIVRVTAGGRTYTKVMDGNSGYLSHSVHPLYFGLGDAEEIEKLEVTWPTGRTQSVPAKLNSTVDIREAGGA